MYSPKDLEFIEVATCLRYLTSPEAEEVLEKQRIHHKKGDEVTLSDLLLRLDILNSNQVFQINSLVEKGYFLCKKCSLVYSLPPDCGAPFCPKCGNFLQFRCSKLEEEERLAEQEKGSKPFETSRELSPYAGDKLEAPAFETSREAAASPQGASPKGEKAASPGASPGQPSPPKGTSPLEPVIPAPAPTIPKGATLKLRAISPPAGSSDSFRAFETSIDISTIPLLIEPNLENQSRTEKGRWKWFLAGGLFLLFLLAEGIYFYHREQRVLLEGERKNLRAREKKVQLLLGEMKEFFGEKASLSELIQMKGRLDKIWNLFPANPSIREALFQVERTLGLVALKAKNYPLSRLCFDRCRTLGKEKEADELLKRLEREEKGH